VVGMGIMLQTVMQKNMLEDII